MSSGTLPQATRRPLRTEEIIALLVALVLHVLLVAAMLLQPDPDKIAPLPERMTVSLSTDVSLESTAPDPVSESRAAVAPTLSDLPAPPQSETQPATESAPDTRTTRSTAPRPRETAAPQPRPTSTPTQSGGSRIGTDFLPGAGASQTEETRIPASQIGRSAKASIVQAISRQIKPHWTAPSGAEADQLITILAFRLDEDGRLQGRPRVVSQSGVTAANAPQKDLHAERAIRAVQLASPFDLPAEYYNAWKSITGARFDRNLSR